MERPFYTFFIVSNLIHWCYAYLSCYECTMIPQIYVTNKTNRLCSQFSEDSRFEVPCLYSTFCMKKTIETLIHDQIVRIEERDCASQKHKYQNYTDGKWRVVTAVEETIYKEGCFPAEKLGLKSSKAEYCYCSSNLCNGGKRSAEMTFFHHTDTMSVIFIFNVVKLMRSAR